MSLFFKIVVIFFSCVFLFVTSFGIISYVLAKRSLPDYNRVVESSLIDNEITVLRDNYAIPNIKGKTDEDVFFALGYVHAQDRLWQMLLLRRTAQGKLSEYFGEDTINSDILMRTLDIYNRAHKSTTHLSSEILKLISSYSNGVNQRLTDIQNEGRGRGTPNLFLFPPKVAPWTPTDSLAILKLLGLQNNESAKKEIIRLNLLKAGVSPEMLSDLFIGIPDISTSSTFSSVRTLSKFKSNIENKTNSIPNSKLSNPVFDSNLGFVNASNAWVALPNRTASGSTLAGYNLHTNFDVPLRWMLTKLTFDSDPVIGATIPGVPAILTGRSKYLSWGITSSNLDNQDLIIESINPSNLEEYLDQSGYKKFGERTVLINIRRQPGITYTVKSTDRGPIMPPESFGINSVASETTAIALKWTGFDTADRSIESFILTMKAKNVSTAKKAFEHLVVPSYNVLLSAPTEVTLLSAGKIPNRLENLKNGYGVIPSLGWKDPIEWAGYLEFDKNPYTIATDNGILFNSNNKLKDTSYPEHFSYDWDNGQRQLRMQDLFAKRDYHSLQSFKEIQSDIVSPSARTVLPLLAKNLWFTQTFDLSNSLANSRKKVLDLLAGWNGEMSIHLPQPLIYKSWASQFQKMILQDELGLHVQWFKSVRPDFLERVLRNIDGAGVWCDIKQTQKLETCDEIASMSLDNSIVMNSKLIGPDVTKWRWGDYHKAHFVDKVIGRLPLLSYFTNLSYDLSGGDNTLSMAKSIQSSNNMHQVRYGSTLKIIVDLANPEHSFFSIPTGQSGHFLSKHYDDFLPKWQRNEYVQIYLGDDPINSSSHSKMIFRKILAN